MRLSIFISRAIALVSDVRKFAKLRGNSPYFEVQYLHTARRLRLGCSRRGGGYCSRGSRRALRWRGGICILPITVGVES